MLDAGKSQKKDTKKHKEEEGPKDLFTPTLKNAVGMGATLASIIGMGCLCPDPSFMTMFSTFALSVIAGYQSVWGVQPALHTPLMSITNAISGITAVGGLLLLGGGFLPHTIPQFLAASAVLASAINITGGFIVTKRMLDMFKRPTDPAEFNYLYGLTGAGSVGALLAAHMAGVPNIYTMGFLASSLCCIGGITGLSN
jgi:NAD(P) transhydrogenase